MTVIKAIAGLALAAAFVAPSASAADEEPAWLPRAMPADYAAALGGMPRAMPADYAAAGVPLAREAATARPAEAASARPGTGFDWVAALIGAGGAVGALVLVLLGGTLLRRRTWFRTA